MRTSTTAGRRAMSSIVMCMMALYATIPQMLLAQNAPVGAGRGTGPGPISQTELLARVQSLGDSLTKASKFSGVILLARKGETVYEHAFGLADREAKIPNNVSTTFNVSSIGKLFTQVAIGQLVQQGKVAFDSTIGRYLPDYPNKEAASKVTIRQLLDHRSGIMGDIFQRPSTLKTNRDVFALFADKPLAFAPGSKNEYSNAGYVVLGEIIARVSGLDYHEYMKRNVFDKVGMTATGFPAADAPPKNTAIGYTVHPESEDKVAPLAPNTRIKPYRGSAAGGTYSNTSDLLRFFVAWRAGTTGSAPRRTAGIMAGGSPGSNGMIAEDLPGGYDIIVLANLDPPAAGQVVNRIEQWLGSDEAQEQNGRGRSGGAPNGMKIISRGDAANGAGALDANAPITSKEFPDSPVGRAAKEYLRAFNSGDAETMRKYIETSLVPDAARPTDQRVQGYKGLFADQGVLTLVGVQSAKDDEITFAVNSPNNGQLQVMLSIEHEAPRRVKGVQFRVER